METLSRLQALQVNEERESVDSSFEGHFATDRLVTLIDEYPEEVDCGWNPINLKKY